MSKLKSKRWKQLLLRVSIPEPLVFGQISRHSVKMRVTAGNPPHGSDNDGPKNAGRSGL